MRSVRIGLGGLALAAAYLAAASWTFAVGTLPVRPFFEGTGPPPAYNWVAPPEEFAEANVMPEPYEETISIESQKGPDGPIRAFVGGTFSTGDGQVSLSVPSGAFEAKPGQTGIRFRLEQVDPAALADPPPERAVDGNGIVVTATYEPDGTPAEPLEQDCALGGCINLIVRFPAFGAELWHLGDDGLTWDLIPTQQVPSAFQLYGSVESTGTFVVTGAAGTGKAPSDDTRTMFAIGLGGVAVVAAVVAQRRSRRKSKAPTGKSGPPGKRGKKKPSGSKRR